MSLDVTKELGQNFIEYAMAVNTDRSIPDATSGLKPVARRILWGAFDSGRTSNKPYVKNARIVGDVMGALHPHGDSSIYGALVRLSQDWVMRYPLIDFHGNQGSINGDGPAAMRYTEGRLSKLSEDGLLYGIKKKCVDYSPTYDDSDMEPNTFPAVFPNLLCNPNSGIGVALSCSWACHNLNEVKQAIFDYMDGKEPMLPGPDFPTGGIIINSKDIPQIMRTGHGTVKIRSKYTIQDNTIVITEIPYGCTIEALLDEIGKYAEENDIGITDIKDQTNNKGIKIVIKCNKNSSPTVIMEKLFAKTNLQSSFSYNQVALVNKIPTEMNLEDCCKIYVQHNINCIIRQAQFDLNKAEERQHIVEGLLKALEDIDNIIALIKSSANATEAQNALIEKYKFSVVQAKAILDMKLAKLANLEKIELQEENNQLKEEIKNLNTLISNTDVQKQELKDRLTNLTNKYGDARRTELSQINISSEEKEIAYVEPEKCVVVMSESGLIKRIPASSFKTQRRNGKGVKTTDDVVNCIIRTNTIDSLMVFTDKGTMYRILVDNIPVGNNITKGTPITSLIEMCADEHPVLIYSIYRDTAAKYVLFTTKNGIMKKTALDEYIKTKKKTGIAAITIKENDSLANVCLVNDEDVIVVTKNGYVLEFDSKEVTMTGRTTMGMKAIVLGKNDEVIATLPIHNKEDSLAIFTEKGMGKKVSPKEIVKQSKGCKGLFYYKPTEITGNITAATLVENEDNILVIGQTNSICVNAKDIPEQGRTAVGGMIIKGNIKAVSKI